MDIPISALYDTTAGRVEAEVLDVGNLLLVTEEELKSRPCLRDGVSIETEEKIRTKACEILHGVLTLCGVDRVVVCTAQVFLHRYYCQKSITRFDFRYVTLAAAFLALKTEETAITEDELIPIFCRFLGRAASENSLEWVTRRTTEFDLWWDWLVCLEMDVLIALGFKLHVAKPHKLMFTYIQKLEISHVLQDAWMVLNDSYYTTACVRFKSEVLACGAIFFVTRQRKIALPDGGKYPWWELFGSTERELYEFALIVHELYSRSEEDFDFAVGVDLEFKNERADGLKRPHPLLIRPNSAGGSEEKKRVKGRFGDLPRREKRSRHGRSERSDKSRSSRDPRHRSRRHRSRRDS